MATTVVAGEEEDVGTSLFLLARSISISPQRDLPATAAERMCALRILYGVVTEPDVDAIPVVFDGLTPNSFSNFSWNFFSALSSASFTAGIIIVQVKCEGGCAHTKTV